MTHPGADEREEAILRALEMLEEGSLAGAPVGTVEREVLEIFGLMPLELEPMQPRPDVKARLMSSLGTAAKPRSEGAREGTVAGDREERSPERSVASFRPAEPSLARPVTRWAMPLAAVLTFLMIGISGFLFSRIQEQGTVIDRLQAEIRGLRESRIAAGSVEAQTELMDALRSLEAVPASEVELCHLGPEGQSPIQPEARARLFMLREEGGRWYLRTSNLDRAPEGQVYILWFLSNGQPVDRQLLGREVREAVSHHLPPDLDSVMVTLETSVAPERPTGPQVLFGRERDMIVL